ncbi:hypothetical protein TIFTF001_035533 [Ficus carica]|uniref:Uncharacterized protein n=1 Tax=Ficus carica TaxID=3494 RepID=A0AA88E2M1_FICCA|nr:hypothetical protein TIFTF001_035512 [Ficus carica]GMN66448.1 hypothetical protein TIFTF001_035515 [Ficus carica]GMN66465.1 hypothetical protein TIFTF001_035530 [Ficus carica]GMN66466.1 hypothetical protein TIFTF001_035533 [Ficus carica]
MISSISFFFYLCPLPFPCTPIFIGAVAVHGEIQCSMSEGRDIDGFVGEIDFVATLFSLLENFSLSSVANLAQSSWIDVRDFWHRLRFVGSLHAARTFRCTQDLIYS